MQEGLEVVGGTRVPVMGPHGPREQCREVGLPEWKEAGSHRQSCSSRAAWSESELPVTGSMQAEAAGLVVGILTLGVRRTLTLLLL